MLCCLWCEAHGPIELLRHTTLFSPLNAKERRWWLKVMIAVEKKKEVHRDFKHAQSSLAWGHHPLQCKEHTCLWKAARCCLFSFLFSYKEAKYRASTVWMLVYIQWDSHPLVLLVQSFEQTLKSSLRKVTCASIFQLWNASFPTQALRITVRLAAFSGGGRQRGSYLFIQVSVKLLLTCDTMQGLLALPAG